MFSDTESVHSQMINFDLVETSLLDRKATDGEPAYRQCTDGDCAARRRSHSKPQ
jgi:hypothetical protein